MNDVKGIAHHLPPRRLLCHALLLSRMITPTHFSSHQS